MLMLPGPAWTTLDFTSPCMHAITGSDDMLNRFTINKHAIYLGLGSDETYSDAEHTTRTASTLWDGVSFYSDIMGII